MKLEFRHRRPDGSVVQTIGKWSPREAILADWIGRYIEALLPGGKCAYVSEMLGYTPIPFEAFVLDGTKVVDIWPPRKLKKRLEAISA